MQFWPLVMFSYEYKKADKRFFAFLKKHFSWEDVSMRVNFAVYLVQAMF
jgi:hypothetical protein